MSVPTILKADRIICCLLCGLCKLEDGSALQVPMAKTDYLALIQTDHSRNFNSYSNESPNLIWIVHVWTSLLYAFVNAFCFTTIISSLFHGENPENIRNPPISTALNDLAIYY